MNCLTWLKICLLCCSQAKENLPKIEKEIDDLCVVLKIDRQTADFEKWKREIQAYARGD